MYVITLFLRICTQVEIDMIKTFGKILLCKQKQKQKLFLESLQSEGWPSVLMLSCIVWQEGLLFSKLFENISSLYKKKTKLPWKK